MYNYNKNFYESQKTGSHNSSKIILPLVFDVFNPKSVIDLGCGVGTWLETCLKLGTKNIMGVDGPYVDKKMLRIPVKNFLQHDLRKPINMYHKYDLAISLEVAEHLPTNKSYQFVRSLVGLSDTVLFSAAIPKQGGTNHINEQWQDYWVNMFLKFDYRAIDLIRPKVWDNKKIEWWYAQNIIVFVRYAKIRKNNKIKELYNHNNKLFSIVHPSNYMRVLNPVNISLTKVIKTFSERIFKKQK